MSEEVTIENPAAVLAALERAKADAKKYREELEALQAAHEPLVEELNGLKGKAKADAIEAKVRAEGADPKRVMQFLKVDDIEFTNGELKGFEENFSTLKTALPELFDPKRRVGGAVELETSKDANVVKSTSEIQAERLLRNMR